ncbi:MAG: hypothetical protein KBB52_03230 [Candidatus Omnitrophica bacterium]|nr:hypothetical protein [Candidatus Omnitrophota bacterium]
MKYILSVIFAISLAADAAFAHPPSSIKADISGNKVDVTVKHSVADPKNHYIKYIGITAGGGTIAEKEFTEQTDNTKQTASFEIPDLNKGDTITIEAVCLLSGERKRDIKVE